MRSGEIDYTQIVRYLGVFLKLPQHQRTRDDLLAELLQTPPTWLVKETPKDQKINLPYLKQIENDQHLYELTLCVQAIAQSMYVIAKSRFSYQYCSMVYPNSATTYPYNREGAHPAHLVRVSLQMAKIPPKTTWLGLHDITLQTGVNAATKQPFAILGLLFQHDKQLTVTTIDLNGHLECTDITLTFR